MFLVTLIKKTGKAKRNKAIFTIAFLTFFAAAVIDSGSEQEMLENGDILIEEGIDVEESNTNQEDEKEAAINYSKMKLVINLSQVMWTKAEKY
ncbi:MAG: hypothetical protein APF76_03520 [Desulfitibacter sp. BRH_c19]|nr:MAG: hypothetical protein APF76_03520 [Desulfitibacter sp. BRH_c19]